jgi:hypothetical protein
VASGDPELDRDLVLLADLLGEFICRSGVRARHGSMLLQICTSALLFLEQPRQVLGECRPVRR